MAQEIDVPLQLDRVFFFYGSRFNRLVVSPTRFPLEISSESEMRGEEIAAGDDNSPEEGIRILSDKVMVRQAVVVVNHSQSCCISVLSGTVQERRNIPDGVEYTSKQYSLSAIILDWIEISKTS